ncbi:E3 ubiquitin-protein ligase MARCHF7-like isoform X1 [Mixophyes fleayi]|uniref:E3 ubiquitin-protein ligase MARCHF7-like isoform X1 n=1 Tax=Mixophyes fleayi TaxID=3061075 RepID=UPI003F4DF04F
MFHSDLTMEHERERRTDSSIHGILDHEHGNSDNTPSYLQDRVSSYAQGARPKENSLSTVQLNTSINHQLPSQGSSFTESSRSLGPVASTDLPSPQRDNSLDFGSATSRNEAATRITSGRISPVQQRPASDNTTDTAGRRTTRHLLSRLASSMSSACFSRQSSQDSINRRSPDAEEAHSSLCNASPQPSPATPGNMDTPENRPSEQSRAFTFFRRRRRGLSTVSPNQSSESEAESYRSGDSERRTPASWLPLSLRNRCAPLFSRRRREGRHETARASSTSDSGRIHSPLRRTTQNSTLGEAQTVPQLAAADANFTPLSADSPSGTANTASIANAIFSRRNSGISDMLPSSFLHYSVPAALGNSLSDNVMITVDLVPSGRTSDGQESEKSENSRDPEKLKKIQESLHLKDWEEEEGDLCKFCLTGMSTPTDPFLEPCKCSGSLQYIHQDCMKKWLHTKINSGSSLETITTCELCNEKLELNLEDFDIKKLYRAPANERVRNSWMQRFLALIRRMFNRRH